MALQVFEQTQLRDLHETLLRRLQHGVLQGVARQGLRIIEILEIGLYRLVDQADVGDEITGGVDDVEARADRATYPVDPGLVIQGS